MGRGPAAGRAGGDRSGRNAGDRALRQARRDPDLEKTFGFHPLLAYADHGTGGGGEPAAELLRPGRPGSNPAVDHVTSLDAALAQIPEPLRRPDEQGRVAVLVRTDAAGATKDFVARLHQLVVEFPVGASFAHLDIAPALALLPAAAWTPA